MFSSKQSPKPKKQSQTSKSSSKTHEQSTVRSQPKKQTKKQTNQSHKRSDFDATNFLKNISLFGGTTLPSQTQAQKLNVSTEVIKQKSTLNTNTLIKKKSGIATIKAFNTYNHENEEANATNNSSTRIVFVSSQTRFPVTVFSLVQRKRDIDTPIEQPVNTPNDDVTKNISYANFLNSTWVSLDSESVIDDEEDISTSANKVSKPSIVLDFVDDPELKTGKHRTVLDLVSYRSSLIPFVKPEELREALDEQFREKHPWLNEGVTLYKIRKLKRKLLDIVVEKDLEISTLALAYIYLEKLLRKNVIFKENLQLYGATCFMLALKFNDPLAFAMQSMFKNVWECMEKYFSFPSSDLVAAEFEVFAKLQFGLFVEPKDVLPHIKRAQINIEIID